MIIGGIAKGSGMIAPDMATMLSFVFTNAAIPTDVLHTVTARAVDKSFNDISVDVDTSTSYTVIVFATGAAKNPKISKPNDTKLRAFRIALEEVDGSAQQTRDEESF